MILIKLRVEACAVMNATSGWSCRIITVDVESVEDVRVLCVIIMLPSLLKENEDMLRALYPRCNQPRIICIPSAAAHMQHVLQVFPLGRLQEVFIGQGLPFTSQLKLRDPEVQLTDDDPPSCPFILQDHLSVILQSNLELKLHWWQQSV